MKPEILERQTRALWEKIGPFDTHDYVEAALRAELRLHYPTLKGDDWVTLVAFEVGEGA